MYTPMTVLRTTSMTPRCRQQNLRAHPSTNGGPATFLGLLYTISYAFLNMHTYSESSPLYIANQESEYKRNMDVRAYISSAHGKLKWLNIRQMSRIGARTTNKKF